MGPYGPSMDPYGPPMDLYGPPMKPYGPLWTSMDPYGPSMDPYGPPMDFYGPPMDPLWTPTDPYGPLWTTTNLPAHPRTDAPAAHQQTQTPEQQHTASTPTPEQQHTSTPEQQHTSNSQPVRSLFNVHDANKAPPLKKHEKRKKPQGEVNRRKNKKGRKEKKTSCTTALPGGDMCTVLFVRRPVCVHVSYVCGNPLSMVFICDYNVSIPRASCASCG